MRHLFASFLAVAVLAVPWLILHPEYSKKVYLFIDQAQDQIASVILVHSPKSVTDIRSRYLAEGNKGLWRSETAKRVNVLLVPGHEPNYGGAEYADLKEREMAVDLALELERIMSFNDNYQVFVTRGKKSWNPIFEDYFNQSWKDIIAWTKGHKEEVDKLVRLGEFHPVTSSVSHNTVSEKVALRLYGIGKWSNENDMDIVIHIHFNDHPGHSMTTPGKYSGFAIYVPQDEFYNSSSTQTVANSIFNRLKKYNAVSDFPGERNGIVETQDLIAVGAYNSIDAASMLIEYGYIYEPQFNDPELYNIAIKDLAFQTYLGLQDFFDDQVPVNFTGAFDTLAMPYTWTRPLTESSYNKKDIYSLQTALVIDGSYPPGNRTFGDCPRSGNFGACTKTALEEFQKKKKILGEKGMVGSKTLNELNRLFSVNVI